MVAGVPTTAISAFRVDLCRGSPQLVAITYCLSCLFFLFPSCYHNPRVAFARGSHSRRGIRTRIKLCIINTSPINMDNSNYGHFFLGTKVFQCIYASLRWKLIVHTMDKGKIHRAHWCACIFVTFIWTVVRTKSPPAQPSVSLCAF